MNHRLHHQEKTLKYKKRGKLVPCHTHPTLIIPALISTVNLAVNMVRLTLAYAFLSLIGAGTAYGERDPADLYLSAGGSETLKALQLHITARQAHHKARVAIPPF